MEIKKKKMFKSKHSFCAQFHTKTGDSFLKRWNITNILLQIFSTWNIWFFWRFWPKNWKGWSHNIETFHKEKSGVLEKKPRKQKFYGGSPSCSNLVLWDPTNHSTALHVCQPMAAWFSISSYLKQFTMGAEVFILPNS